MSLPELLAGRCSPRFEPVRDALAANLASGADLGASVCILVDGQVEVDLWGGTLLGGGPWQEDTVVNVWSTTKTMTALCTHLLADQGVLDLDAPVARYWPGFEQNGKAGVLVRHVLGHASGLPVWDEPMAPADLYDWEKACGILARQAPRWEPGTATGYHGITQGYLLGEVVRRVTGTTVGALLADAFAQPLGADFHIGTPAEVDPRVARCVPYTSEVLPPGGDEELRRLMLTNPHVATEQTWETAWRRAESPAANGHGNARSVATIQHVVACRGEVNGRRFLSEEACGRIFAVQGEAEDRVLGLPIRWGMGYALNSETTPVSANPETCYWGGRGGSIVVNDLAERLTVAYVMNRMGNEPLGDTRAGSIIAATHIALAAA